jgi:hypothetical protein
VTFSRQTTKYFEMCSPVQAAEAYAFDVQSQCDASIVSQR